MMSAKITADTLREVLARSVIREDRQFSLGLAVREALDDLIQAAEQKAADEGEDDLIAATPRYDAARAARDAWDAANGGD